MMNNSSNEKVNIPKGSYIVLKFGTECLIRPHTEKINYDVFGHICEKTAKFYEQGYKPVIVSSGAVFMGKAERARRNAKHDIDSEFSHDLKMQILAGQGQATLIGLYKDYLAQEGLGVAQCLVTHRDLQDEGARDNLVKVIDSCYKDGSIVVLNENDMISNEELKKRALKDCEMSNGNFGYHFGDNDVLSYLVALDLNAYANVMFNPVGGLYEDINNPDSIIKEVKIDDEVDVMKLVQSRSGSKNGRSGPQSKVSVCFDCAKKGIYAMMAGLEHVIDKDIDFLDIIEKDLENKTIFYPFK